MKFSGQKVTSAQPQRRHGGKTTAQTSGRSSQTPNAVNFVYENFYNLFTTFLLELHRLKAAASVLSKRPSASTVAGNSQFYLDLASSSNGTSRSSAASGKKKPPPRPPPPKKQSAPVSQKLILYNGSLLAQTGRVKFVISYTLQQDNDFLP